MEVFFFFIIIIIIIRNGGGYFPFLDNNSLNLQVWNLSNENKIFLHQLYRTENHFISKKLSKKDL